MCCHVRGSRSCAAVWRDSAVVGRFPASSASVTEHESGDPGVWRDALHGARVRVVGDAMLDVDVAGTVEAVSASTVTPSRSRRRAAAPNHESGSPLLTRVSPVAAKPRT